MKLVLPFTLEARSHRRLHLQFGLLKNSRPSFVGLAQEEGNTAGSSTMRHARYELLDQYVAS